MLPPSFGRPAQRINTQLRTVEEAFNILCQSADELNSFNSATIFIIFVTKTLSFIIELYMFITMINDSKFDILPHVSAMFFSDIIFFPVMMNAADSPVDEVNSITLLQCLIILMRMCLFSLSLFLSFSFCPY